MKCNNCGAPIVKMDKCPYCDCLYPKATLQEINNSDNFYTYQTYQTYQSFMIKNVKECNIYNELNNQLFHLRTME